jgi:hypothetical protein
MADLMDEAVVDDVELVNLTSHTIDLYGGSSYRRIDSIRRVNEWAVPVLSIAPSGTVVRVRTTDTVVGGILVAGKKVPLLESRLDGIDALPDPVVGIGYIVSGLCAPYVVDLGRTDFYRVYKQIRDKRGSVVGAWGVSRIK